MHLLKRAFVGSALTLALLPLGAGPARASGLDEELWELLAEAGFTGRIEASLEQRLGRPVDKQLAGLGQVLFFDSFLGLHDDNSCAGCHAPSNGFGDTQSIAIGVDNNGRVGPNREGPRNQRRSPMVLAEFQISLTFANAGVRGLRVRAGSLSRSRERGPAKDQDRKGAEG